MRRFARLSMLPFVLSALILSVFGSQQLPRAQGASALVKTASAHILVTASGMTLYVFSQDKKGMSMCTGKCASAWPPLLVPMGAKVPAAMTGMMGKFGELMLTGGKDQLTYDGAPLYTFTGDKKPGDMNGQGLAGLWWVVVAPPAMSTTVSAY